MSKVSQLSAITENGNVSSTSTEGMSPVEYLELAVQAGKNLRAFNIPLPLNVAQSILDMVRNLPKESIPSPHISPHSSPPTIPTTRLTDAELSARVHTRLPVCPSEKRAMKDAGRGWHRGM